ncbi:MAG: hypothetical protein OHK0045_11960 [Raineya sp.]
MRISNATKKIYWQTLLLGLLSTSVWGQNALFSQYYYPTPIFSNPAWVAARQELFTGLHIRSQQIGLGQGIHTQSFQFCLPLLDAYNQRAGGFGLGVLNEQAGKGRLLQSNAILANLAYNLHFSDYDHLAFGLQGGYFFRRINPSRLTSESQYTINGFDASIPLGEPFEAFRSDFPSINAGLIWYGEDENNRLLYYLGVAGYFLNRPNTTWFAEVSRIPLLWNISGEWRAYEKDGWAFYPTARYIRQAQKANLNVGSLARYQIDKSNTIAAGLWYKNSHTLVLSFDLAYQNYFFAASYDFAFANKNVLGQTNSALEVSLAWRKPIVEKKRKINRPPTTKPTPKPTKQKPPVATKDSSSYKEANQTRTDTTTNLQVGLGEKNRIEEKGSMKVIIRETLEKVAPKKKITLSHNEKLLLKPIFPDKEDMLMLSPERVYQIAQMLFRNQEIKLKIVLYCSQSEDLEFFSTQADDFRSKLLLQGIPPAQIKRQNVLRPKEKTRVEWVILR